MSDKNFIDSNIWLYALLDSKGDKRHQEAVSFLKDRDVHVISSQVIKETLSNLIKKANVSREYIKDLVDIKLEVRFELSVISTSLKLG